MPRIVIADDEPMILSLVGRIVTGMSCTFHSATNGVEALQRVEQVMPDLVLSDIMMPEMSGIDLVRAMKNNPALSHIPIVLMSSGEREAQALAAGCTAFISKPFRIEELIRILRRLVAG